MCSVSRSALLSGRYAFLTGLYSEQSSNADSGFDSSLTLFPELLQDNKWRTFIAGKYHIGYYDEQNSPYNRGFRKGVFSYTALDYYKRAVTRSLNRLDNLFGHDLRAPIKNNRDAVLGSDYKLTTHDTYRIENTGTNYYATPAYIGDNGYNDDIYTNEIKQFIGLQNGNNPFFIYYSMFTPHRPVTEPPLTRYDQDGFQVTIDYSLCHDKFPGGASSCTVDIEPRCVLCKQGLTLLYL